MGPRSQCERRWVFYLRKSRHCPKFGCVFFPQPLSARASTSLEKFFSTFPKKRRQLSFLCGSEPGWQRGALYVHVCATLSPSHTRNTYACSPLPTLTPSFQSCSSEFTSRATSQSACRRNHWTLGIGEESQEERKTT